MHTKYLFYLFVSLFLIQSCQPEQNEGTAEAQESKLGEVNLNVIGKKEALPHFEKGLLLLHSFEYEDAREAFLAAQEVDPTFAMAIWGEAMTYNHGLWREQEYEKGQEALAKLGETQEERQKKIAPALEKDLFEGVEILYGEGSKQERDKAYSNHMESLRKKYPNNQEIAAFYALSVLGAVPVGRDEEKYEQSAVIAKGILKENPNHPGALHYLIHSYDDPKHAVKAITAANSYSKVAPDAAHALHMPSHIYVAMGMWNEVISSNIASYEASIKRMERKDLSDNSRSFHALHWLMYGLTQKEKWTEAEEAMQEIIKYANANDASKGARAYHVRMKGNFLVEKEDWTGDIAKAQIDISDLNISLASSSRFIDGMVAYNTKQPDTLRAIIDGMKMKRENASLLVSDEGIPMCNAGGSNRSLPNKQDLIHAEIFEMQLEGLYANLKKDQKAAEEWLKKAVDTEYSISYSYGPPKIFKPTNELYADWLMEQGRHQEALEQYQYALKRNPKRRITLNGQLAAAKALGNEDLVKETEALIKEVQSDKVPSMS